MTENTPKQIRELSKSMINKIAAGEVIERPANVVKELVENAIDAGATRIDVEIGPDVKDLIKVVDNGCGIPRDQIALALSPHATSKIAEPDDLFRIATLGFRGEALASIAEISHLTLTTRVADSNEGSVIRCEGSDFGPIVPASRAVGTSIEVRDLFFNVPVRRKFMRSAVAEFGQIKEAIVRLAVPHPELAFSLRRNGKIEFDLPPVKTKRERLAKLFGDYVVRELLEIEPRQSAGGIVLSGFVGTPNLSRGTSAMQYLFVNGRFFKDKSLGAALKNAYQGLLKQGCFPVVFLNIDTPPDFVDVNVHPTKMEVRFLDSQTIYSKFMHGVRDRLLAVNNERQMTLGEIADAAGIPPLMAPQAPEEAPDPERPAALVAPAARHAAASQENATSADPVETPKSPKSKYAADQDPPREVVCWMEPELDNPRDAMDQGSGGNKLDSILKNFNHIAAQRRAKPAKPAESNARADTTDSCELDADSERDALDPASVQRAIDSANAALEEAAALAAEERARAEAAQTTRLLQGKTAEFRKFPNLNDSVSSRVGRKEDVAPPAKEPSRDVRQETFAATDAAPEATSFERRREKAIENNRRVANLGDFASRIVALTSDGRPAVQLCDRYLVMEAPDGVAFVDQHALHERILFEKLKARYDSGNVDVQMLLVPVVVDLAPSEFAYVVDNKALFASIGLKVEPFGGSSVVVNGYPACIPCASVLDVFQSALKALLAKRDDAKLSDLVEGALEQMACKAAVKAGDKLTPEGVGELVAMAEEEVMAHHCPHGRPAVVVLTKDKIDQFFKRD